MALFHANLLLIQHLETLYLGEIHVRVVRERVWRKAQECALSRASQLDLVASKSPNEAHVWNMQGSWRVTPAGALQDKTSNLARRLACSSDSQLSQVARPSHQTTLFVTNLTLRIPNYKVEFNRPSCWLYSVSNLLVI